MFVRLCALFIFNVATTHSQISLIVYGNVYKDQEFFTRTFPWIIDNIEGKVMVQFYMQGSGRYTVPQMCVLSYLRFNPFLQAQFLKCLAEEHPTQICVCESGMAPESFRDCVVEYGNLASDSADNFKQLDMDVTPQILLDHSESTVFGVDDIWYLKKICTMFGGNMPRGCTKPIACNGTEALKHVRAIAQFDKCCADEASRSDAGYTTTTLASETSSSPTTSHTESKWMMQ